MLYLFVFTRILFQKPFHTFRDALKKEKAGKARFPKKR